MAGPRDYRTQAAASRAGLGWSRARQQYRDAGGRFISPLQVRKAIDEDIAATAARLEANARAFQLGALTGEEWSAAHIDDMRRLLISHAAAAKGGFYQLDQSDYGAIGAAMREQLRYYNRWKGQINASPQIASSMGFPRRAGLYAKSGRMLFEKFTQSSRSANGSQWASRVQNSREGCPGCSDIAGLWFRLEEFPPIGSLECNVNCLCTVIYSDDDEPPGPRG